MPEGPLEKLGPGDVVAVQDAREGCRGVRARVVEVARLGAGAVASRQVARSVAPREVRHGGAGAVAPKAHPHVGTAQTRGGGDRGADTPPRPRLGLGVDADTGGPRSRPAA